MFVVFEIYWRFEPMNWRWMELIFCFIAQVQCFFKLVLFIGHGAVNDRVHWCFFCFLRLRASCDTNKIDDSWASTWPIYIFMELIFINSTFTMTQCKIIVFAVCCVWWCHQWNFCENLYNNQFQRFISMSSNAKEIDDEIIKSMWDTITISIIILWILHSKGNGCV